MFVSINGFTDTQARTRTADHMSPMNKAPARKRSSRQPKEARIEAILQAARAVFEQVGYERAKIAEIAQAVGVVEGTVFHYFGSKRVLALKLMERFYSQITDELGKGIAGIRGTRNRLRYVIGFHLRVIDDNAALCAMILNESRAMDHEFTKDIQRFNREYTHTLGVVIQEGIASGELRDTTSVALVRNTVYGSIEHALWSHLADGQRIDVERTAEQLVELVFSGIRPADDGLGRDEVATLVKRLNRMMKGRAGEDRNRETGQ